MTVPDLSADLAAVVKAAVRDALAEHAAADAQLGDARIGFTEAEAAAALGLQRHVLADARRRGEIHARRVGKKFVYSRETLASFLAEVGESQLQTGRRRRRPVR
jgi:Helix-turn-helix domain